MRKQIVQGDILFIPCKDFAIEETGGREKFATKIIARGEKTGHAHVLSGPAELFGFLGESPSFLRAFDRVKVAHEEHGAAFLDAGTWQIIRQRQFDYQKMRQQPIED